MKKFLLPMFAILLAVGFSAFTQPEKVRYDDPLWYYTGVDDSEHGNQEFYVPLEGQGTQAGCPGESIVRCVIAAPVDGMTGKPDLNNISAFPSFKP
ncbi:DUF6520 family protein [Lacibacter sp. H407]|uniref:DUF6520 family protein n=1 Tax=Lacibacter sp. H407 TaxID=3133423 RepID=UPI0030BB2D35